MNPPPPPEHHHPTTVLLASNACTTSTSTKLSPEQRERIAANRSAALERRAQAQAREQRERIAANRSAALERRAQAQARRQQQQAASNSQPVPPPSMMMQRPQQQQPLQEIPQPRGAHRIPCAPPSMQPPNKLRRVNTGGPLMRYMAQGIVQASAGDHSNSSGTGTTSSIGSGSTVHMAGHHQQSDADVIREAICQLGGSYGDDLIVLALKGQQRARSIAGSYRFFGRLRAMGSSVLKQRVARIRNLLGHGTTAGLGTSASSKRAAGGASMMVMAAAPEQPPSKQQQPPQQPQAVTQQLSAAAAAAAPLSRGVDSAEALTDEQVRILQLVRAGRSIFITGAAGVGKSFVLKRLLEQLRLQGKARRMAVTGSTGIAAVALGGVTLHSFAGIFDWEKKSIAELVRELCLSPIGRGGACCLTRGHPNTVG
jgi:hypothetical protein